MLKLREFEITGLFGRVNINLPLQNNRLILVGYNGIGKSTILNAFYYFISSQWTRLASIKFDTITLKISRKSLSVSRKELIDFIRRPRGWGYRGSPVRVLERARTYLSPSQYDRLMSGRPLDSSTMRELASRMNLPSRYVFELQEYVKEFGQFGFDFGESKGKISKNITEIDEYLTENLNGRILYLPTYRRIEKDLKSIFPEIEDELQSALRMRNRGNREKNVFLELVNFGMEDVISKMSTKMESLRNFTLSEVSKLTTLYLRDVIRNEANTFSSDLADRIDEGMMSSVFAKIDEKVLSNIDKQNLNMVIAKIKRGDSLFDHEKYVAHYVSYLVSAAEQISKLERPIEKFVGICNSYLYGKSLNFDKLTYSVNIFDNFSDFTNPEIDSETVSMNPIEMEELSSGEKQIVSLFSHLILDDNITNYIFIDEPELSLSVDWQRRFLSDVSKTDTCIFLMSVTHSPFIFENELDDYAIDLLEAFDTQ